MKKITFIIIVASVAAIMLMGCKPEVHVHSFSEDWTSDKTSHWHETTCGHDVRDSEDFHVWNHEDYQYDSESGKETRTCSICGYVDEKAHVHSSVTTWTKTATTHKETYDCCGTVKTLESAHTWNHKDYQYDSKSGKDIRTCTVCEYVDEKDHEHTIATKWSIDGEKHWHAASCGKAEHNEDSAVHTWNHEEYQYDSESGKDIRTCTVCNYIDEKDHVHSTVTVWTKTATTHKETYDCCGTVKTLESAHTWNHKDYQYDSKSGKDIRTCTVCEYVDGITHTHTEDRGTITAPTCMTKGFNIYKCSGCDTVLRTEEIADPLGWCETTIDAETFNKATSTSTYVYFGVFPRTIKATSITIDETEKVTMGANTYYKGSDGEWYAKVTAKPWETSYTYSDTTKITKGKKDYFKVEPIKWKVLTTDYNGTKKALLLAEEILTANVPYYEWSLDRSINSKTVYQTNYKYSTIRAYLNGKYESDDTLVKWYNNAGFLQTAFTADAQTLIENTTVVNDGASTSDATGKLKKADGTVIRSGTVEGGDAEYYPDYTCANTTDKIFLLSEQEVTTTAYGFAAHDKYGKGNTRIRVTTDYAKANYASQSTTTGYGSDWWLRSPVYCRSGDARLVSYDGRASSYDGVDCTYRGVVPALSIAF